MLVDIDDVMGLDEIPTPEAQQLNGIKPLDMLPEDRDEFTLLTDLDEIKRARNHVKRAMGDGYRPIPPSKWMVCPLCIQQVEVSGHTDSGAKTPYRAPESLVTHYKSHGGVNEVARQLKVLQEQLPMTNEQLRNRFRVIGTRGAKKDE